MRLTIPLLICFCAPFLVAAEEAAEEAVSGPWTHEATIRLQGNLVSTDNAETSHDSVIQGNGDTYSWRAGFKGALTWEVPRQRLHQTLEMAYGELREEDESWNEVADEILYEAAYNYKPGRHHRPYGAVAAETVFTGPEPDEDPFDPFLLKLSAGYGQEYENMLPESDRFMWRAGVRAQRRWGDDLSDAEDGWELGPEARLRYERQHNESLSYHLQYDVFSEFDDLGHVSHLFQAGLEAKLTSLIAITLTGRAYYEAEPEDAATGATGYDEWSWRQETLIGLVYSF